MPNYNYGQGLLNAAANQPGVDAKKPGAGLFAEYGILSPSEKRQQEMQAQIAQQALAMQQAAMQQQMQLSLAGAKSNAPSGLNFSQFLAMGGAQNLRNADKIAGGMPAMQGVQGNAPATMRTPPFVPNPPAGQEDANGIAWKVVNDAFSKFPDDRTKALKVAGTMLNQLAQQRGDGDLASIAANLIQGSAEAEKEQVENESKRATTKKTKFETNQQRRGTPFDYYNAAGQQVTETPFFDEEGNYIGDKEEGRGVPASRVKTETPGDEEKEYEEFRQYVTAKDEVNERIDHLIKGLGDGAAQGWVASGVNFVNNVSGAIKQLTPEVGSSKGQMSVGAVAELGNLGSKFQKWADKTGVQSSVWGDLVAILAKADNPTGNITENDVRRSADKIGKTFSNPQTVKQILVNAKQFSIKDVEGKYRYMSPKAQDQTKPQYDTFKSRWGKQVTRKGKVKSGPNAGKTVIEYNDGTKEYK